jgi:hypothetical protein
MNLYIKQKGLYWIMLHSHNDLVYTQRYHSGQPDSEINIEKYHSKKHTLIYGFNLKNICTNYKSIPPSAQSVGELALQNYEKWLERDINQVSPNYVTNII